MAVNRIDKAQNYAYTNNNIPDGEKFPQVGSWREISIANGGECNDREIGRIDPWPTFNVMIKDSTNSNYNRSDG